MDSIFKGPPIDGVNWKHAYQQAVEFIKKLREGYDRNIILIHVKDLHEADYLGYVFLDDISERFRKFLLDFDLLNFGLNKVKTEIMYYTVFLDKLENGDYGYLAKYDYSHCTGTPLIACEKLVALIEQENMTENFHGRYWVDDIRHNDMFCALCQALAPLLPDKTEEVIKEEIKEERMEEIPFFECSNEPPAETPHKKKKRNCI